MEINERVHAELQRSGLVSNEEHHIRTLVPRQNLTGADRTWPSDTSRDVLRYSRASKETGSAKARTQGEEHRRADKPADSRTAGWHAAHLRSTPTAGRLVFREEMRSFSVGDRLQFTAPANELKVANRELGTIESIDGDVRCA